MSGACLIVFWEIMKRDVPRITSLLRAEAIRILVQQLGYEEEKAVKIVNSWGVTDISGSEDPSPISRSFRAVKEQGLWDLLNVAEHGNEEETQVLNLLSKPILLTKEEVSELKRLTTKLSQNWNSTE